MNFKAVSIKLIFLSFFISILTSCGVKEIKSNSTPISHDIWNKLLQKHVNAQGKVNYKGLIEDSTDFNKYLTLLKSNHPNEKNWTKNERLAYWINAYNAFTIKLILDHYPVKSIKDIKNGIPFVNTVWDIKFIHIESATYDLNNIEHSIIRPRFGDPRVHMAVNCASTSCPNLRNEAYVAERLDEQLDAAATAFVNDKTKNILDPKNPKLSKIFSWYRMDFNKNGNSVIKFINKYADIKIDENASKDYLDYYWELNEAK